MWLRYGSYIGVWVCMLRCYFYKIGFLLGVYNGNVEFLDLINSY